MKLSELNKLRRRVRALHKTAAWLESEMFALRRRIYEAKDAARGLAGHNTVLGNEARAFIVSEMEAIESMASASITNHPHWRIRQLAELLGGET